MVGAFLCSRYNRKYVHNVHSRLKTTQFRAFWVCTYVFFDVHRCTQCTQGTSFFLFSVCTLCICVYMRFFSCTHRKTTHFRDFFSGVYIVYMFSYVLKTSAGIKQPIQNTIMIFVQLYFEIGVDFLGLIIYNRLIGTQKSEVKT